MTIFNFNPSSNPHALNVSYQSGCLCIVLDLFRTSHIHLNLFIILVLILAIFQLHAYSAAD